MRKSPINFGNLGEERVRPRTGFFSPPSLCGVEIPPDTAQELGGRREDN